MTDNTLNAALRRFGYAKDEMTAHGFRAMAATILNECGKWRNFGTALYKGRNLIERFFKKYQVLQTYLNTI